jgi:hypothetical protein
MALVSIGGNQQTLGRRLCVGGLATALVLLQVAGFAHFFLVAHEVCPEDGELIHARRGAAGSHTLAPVSPDHDVLAGSEAHASVGGHEHCSVFLHQRTRALGGPILGRARPQACSAVLVAPPAADVPAAVPVLFVAPKSSPPTSS